MMFISLYRGSFYLMLFLATLTMSIDATDSKIAMLFPVLVAVAGFLALATVDRHPRLGLTRSAANGLALISIGLVLLEYLIDPTQLLLALAHFLVYLQLIKMFLPKTAEDDWFLYLLGLMQVLVGAVISQSDKVGFTLFCWAFLALWVLTLFSLHRDAQRYLPAASDDNAKGIYTEEPYPGLLDLPFILSGLRVTALTLALGGVIFLAMPRRGTAARSPHGSDPMAKHLTGFDDEVQLGQLGEILENDSVVMSVELFDENKERIRPAGEPLWRGVTMADYADGRWHRQGRSYGTFPIYQPRRDGNQTTIRQQIKLEANDSPVLFGLRPVLDVKGGLRFEPELNSNDGSIARPDPRPGAFDYEVISDADASLPQPGETAPGRGRLQHFLRVPDPIRPKLRAIADPIIKGIPAEDRAAQAHALEAYLRDPSRFSYTLHMTVSDPSIDPVLDFLVNRKEGHCEYFASALTLLLRSAGIPARMVNGFKGGDWNEIAKVLSVRQKHAHSWVEAYLGETPTHQPNWLTLDPTPAGERRQSLERVGGITSNFRQLTDLVRYVYVFFVVGYNADRQKRMIYDPIRELIREARSGFAMMGQAIRPTIANLLHFKDVGQFISVRGFFVSFVALSVLAGLGRALLWVVRRIVRWYRGADEDLSTLSPGVVFYRRLTQLLAEYGLERPSAETQHEFARRAMVFLTGRGAGTETVADVPRQVVDAFYRVRFGHLPLSPDVLKHLEARLDALEGSLRSTGA
jgi:transglutaminase-like putative cysteine protease